MQSIGPDQKWGVHVVFSPQPPPIKYKVEPHLGTVSLVPNPYIFSNFIPLDMDTQLLINTFKNWPEVCQIEIITLGVVLSYSFTMFLHSEI